MKGNIIENSLVLRPALPSPSRRDIIAHSTDMTFIETGNEAGNEVDTVESARGKYDLMSLALRQQMGYATGHHNLLVAIAVR